ncbi:uncharacterized protein LOC127249135 isoform X2 [Andrographis paniculata]|uniref:uncharacterized protein LOC127249135 isoform X2 n=1 Tax=Andrographis paniculata TaxID=175694 RepID=UPI0021E8995A|nr:uncharacterized protein LOC127249135 isoform X2 [Andrographis paniculata]
MTAGNQPPASSSHTQAYGEASYWDNRYALDPSTFDWYQKYPSLAPLIRLYVPPNDRVLIVGCGNSDMKMDVRDMSAFDKGSFGAVIDKGTLDSLLCGQNSRQNAAKMLEEVWRVLKDKGVYILVTYGSPVYRLPLLKDLPWTTKLHVIEKLPSGNSSHQITRDLTSPIALDVNGTSAETIAGVKADVHYIYVCIKDNE